MIDLSMAPKNNPLDLKPGDIFCHVPKGSRDPVIWLATTSFRAATFSAERDGVVVYIGSGPVIVFNQVEFEVFNVLLISDVKCSTIFESNEELVLKTHFGFFSLTGHEITVDATKRANIMTMRLAPNPGEEPIISVCCGVVCDLKAPL